MRPSWESVMSDDMNADERLAAFFEADEAPAVDPGFRTEVMEKVARRRFNIELAVVLLACLLAAAALAAFAPALTPYLVSLLGAVEAPAITLVAIAAIAGLGWALFAGLVRAPRLPVRFF